jgi:hypothetical protein
MTSVIMTAAAIAMAASKKIGQSDLGGWRRGGSFVGICHHSRVRSLAEVNEVCRNRVEVIEPLVWCGVDGRNNIDLTTAWPATA